MINYLVSKIMKHKLQNVAQIQGILMTLMNHDGLHLNVKKVCQRHVETRPVCGGRKRGAGPRRDAPETRRRQFRHRRSGGCQPARQRRPGPARPRLRRRRPQSRNDQYEPNICTAFPCRSTLCFHEKNWSS